MREKRKKLKQLIILLFPVIKFLVKWKDFFQSSAEFLAWKLQKLLRLQFSPWLRPLHRFTYILEGTNCWKYDERSEGHHNKCNVRIVRDVDAVKFMCYTLAFLPNFLLFLPISLLMCNKRSQRRLYGATPCRHTWSHTFPISPTQLTFVLLPPPPSPLLLQSWVVVFNPASIPVCYHTALSLELNLFPPSDFSSAPLNSL